MLQCIDKPAWSAPLMLPKADEAHQNNVVSFELLKKMAKQYKKVRIFVVLIIRHKMHLYFLVLVNDIGGFNTTFCFRT